MLIKICIAEIGHKDHNLWSISKKLHLKIIPSKIVKIFAKLAFVRSI